MSITQPLQHIRPTTPADIEGMVAVHGEAFNDKFVLAFGRRKLRRGLSLIAETWRRQGSAGLQGMWVVEDEQRIVATIALRARTTLRNVPVVPVEWLFIRGLGFVRGMYALAVLSVIEHSPLRMGELYISDVAVAQSHRRQGLATLMLKHADREAQRQGLRYLSLYVHAHNHAAIDLYRKAGFTTAKTHTSVWAWLFLHNWAWLLLQKDVQWLHEESRNDLAAATQ